MMSFVDLKQVIPKIIEQVSFKDYLLHKDYIYKEDKNIDNFQCFIKYNQENKLEDIVFLSLINNQETFYSAFKGDEGTIIDFVKNRYENTDDYELFNPDKDRLIETCKLLAMFIHQHGANKFKKLESSESNDLKTIKTKSFSSYFRLEPINDIKYFNHHGISQATIFNPIFENKIFNAKGLIYKNQVQDINNIVFPMLDSKDSEVGLYYRNLVTYVEHNKEIQKELSFFCDMTDLSGVWKSNSPKKIKATKRNFTIVSDPIEALTHYNIYGNNSAEYFCFFEINQTSLKHFYNELIKEASILHLSMKVENNDLTNELKILIYLINKTYPCFIDEITKTDIHLYIKQVPQDQKLYKPFLTKIINYNDEHTLHSKLILGNAALKYLPSEMVNVANITDTKKENHFYLKIPINIKNIYQILRIIADSFPIQFNINITKAAERSWLKQNKKHTSNINTPSDNIEEQLIENNEVFVHKTR